MQQALMNPKLEPLSTEALRRYCPAIFAKEPHGDVSARYGFFPTYRVLEGMHANGFDAVEVRNYQRRDSHARQFTKHMIRFRQAGALEARKVGDVVPQVVLINSHDRSSPFELYGGLFRLACLNGMLASEGEHVQPIKLRHTINLVDSVVSTSLELIKQHRNVFKYIDVMRKTKLSDKARLKFARDALAIRQHRHSTIDPHLLLVPRRTEDSGADLWHTFNVVQENLTKGGLEGRSANGRRTVSTEIRSIGSDMLTNAGLWTLAMKCIN